MLAFLKRITRRNRSIERPPLQSEAVYSTHVLRTSRFESVVQMKCNGEPYCVVRVGHISPLIKAHAQR